MGEILLRTRLIRYVNVGFRLAAPRGIRFPVVGGLGAQNIREMKHGRERHLDAVITAVFGRTPGAFVDVGVNLGQTLVKVKGIDRGREYVGIEPNPACCHYAQRLITMNGFEGCRIAPVGMHESATLLPLHLRYGDDDPTASLVVDEGRFEFRSERWVAVLRGDDVIDALGLEAISILKIDVEGAELDVLRGLSATIRRFAPVILCEILPDHDEQGNLLSTVSASNGAERARRIGELLRGFGYTFAKIDDRGRVTEVADIEHHLSMGAGDTFDFVFVPPGADWLVGAVNQR